MANFVENALVIDNLSQIGHLATLFDVAEARVADNTHEGIVDVGGYNFSVDGHYAVLHPDDQREIAFLVLPKIFHGFMEMRYVELRNTSALMEAQTVSFRDFLERCKALTEGGLSADNGRIIGSWLVKKTGGLHKPVILGGGYRLDEEGDLDINWHIESPRLQEEVNKELGWRE